MSASRARRAGLNSGGVRAGLRLGEAEGAENFAGRQAAQIFFLLRVVAKSEQRHLHRGIGDAERSGHGGIDARDFFEHQHVGDGVEAGAAPFFGHEHAAAAEFGELFGFQRWRIDLRDLAVAPRAHFVLHELADGVANQFLVVVERKIHSG